jgi:hypothetical protein
MLSKTRVVEIAEDTSRYRRGWWLEIRILDVWTMEQNYMYIVSCTIEMSNSNKRASWREMSSGIIIVWAEMYEYWRRSLRAIYGVARQKWRNNRQYNGTKYKYRLLKLAMK